MLSGVVGAASFPSVEQTIAKVSQQRRPKREGGRKKGQKQMEKGLNKKFVGFSPFPCTFCVGVFSGGVGAGGVGAASFPSVEKIIAKLSQQRWKKRRGGGEKQGKNSGKGLNSQVVSHLFSANSASGCLQVVSVRHLFHLSRKQSQS